MDSVPLSAIDAVCRYHTRRKEIFSQNGLTWHQWYDGRFWDHGPNNLTQVCYKDRICVQYQKDINSLTVPSGQEFGRYIRWTWNGMCWNYYIEDDRWDFRGTPDAGMRELYPDIERLPLASDDIKILMELTYG